MKKFMRENGKWLILGLLFFGAMAAITVWAWPYIMMLKDPAAQEKIQQFIVSLGVWGPLALFALQLLQIIIAFIPGEPVEILAGVLYGGFWGTLICLAGCLLASAAVFWITRRFGVKLVNKIFPKKKLEEFGFLQESKKLDMTVFILFLLPATPKDLLTYLVGLSQMKLWRFLLLSSLARIPALVSSTYLGAAARQGQWGLVLAIFLVTAAVGIVGILMKDKMMALAQKWSGRRKE